MTHHSIEYFAIGGIFYVVGEDVVHKLFALRAGNQHLAHMRYIKDTARLAHGIVFINDVGILDGHIETSKRTDECTKCYVLLIKTGSLIFHRSVII